MLHVTNVTCYIFPDWGCLFQIWLTEMGRSSPAVPSPSFELSSLTVDFVPVRPPPLSKKNQDIFGIVPPKTNKNLAFNIKSH